MENEGRILDFPVEQYIPVDVSWDLGMDDTMVLTYWQTIGRELRIIDLTANNSKGLDWYVKELQNKPYVYGNQYLPHDIRVRELSNGGKTRKQTLYDLGLKNLIDLPKLPLLDGINEVRKILHRTYIHKSKCDQMVEALKTYRREWDPEAQVFGNNPVHDWASHYADAVRVFAMGHREHVDASKLTPVAIGTGYDPINRSDPSYPYLETAQVRQPFNGRYSQNGSSWDPMKHQVADGYYS